MQKMSYSYDFDQRKIMDPLSLSVTLKSFSQDLSDESSELYT